MRSSFIRAAAVLTSGAALGVVAVGPAQAQQSGSAPSSTAAAGPAKTTPGQDPAPTTVAPTSPAGVLPPNATVDQFRAAVGAALGETADVSAELASFGVVAPAGIPSPEGADVREIDVYYYPDDEDPAYSYYSSTIMFTATADAADLVTTFQTAMPAAGFIQTGDSVQNEDGQQVRWLEYDVPAPTSEYDEVSIAIVDDADGDYLQLEISGGLEPATVQAFGALATGVPLLDGQTPTSSSISTLDFGGDVSVTLSTSFEIAVPFADAPAQFEAGLVSTPLTIGDDSRPADGAFYLDGGTLEDIAVYLNEGYPEGTTYGSFSGSFELGS